MDQDRSNSPVDLKLVSRYLVPYSILLVAVGLPMAVINRTESLPAIWLILATFVINIGVKTQGEWLPFSTPMWFRDWRVEANLIADLIVIYLMMPHWPEIWLLLLVVGISLAVYDSLDATVFHCGLFGCVLLLMAWMRNILADYRLGQTLVYGATVVFVGIFVNRLVHVLGSPSEPRDMRSTSTDPTDLAEKMMLVSRYMTPFAGLLVLMGVVFGHVPNDQKGWVVAILAVAMLVNLSSMMGVRTNRPSAPMIRKARMAVNVICNIGLIWILMPFWPEVWLLLLLMVIAQGIYGTRQTTLLWSLGCTLVIIIIASARGMMNRFWAPEVFIFGATYAFIGLFVNRLVGLLKAGALPMYPQQTKSV